MGYSYKSYSDTEEVFKKFVNAAEGQAVYGISRRDGILNGVATAQSPQIKISL